MKYQLLVNQSKVFTNISLVPSFCRVEEQILQLFVHTIATSSTSVTVRQPPATKIPEDKFDSVRCHIESFPFLELHYVRKETKWIFYPSGLSIEKMYNLYRTRLVNEGAMSEIVKSWKYREIFNSEYNISLKPPEKDTCDKCA